MRTITHLIAALLLPLIVCTSCLDEDWSLCTWGENCRILFSFRDAQGNDLFLTEISQVSVMIFDRELNYHTGRTVSAAEMTAFRGATFELEPGEYFIVCWGNPAGKTPSEAVRGLEERTMDMSGSGYPLYYAPSKPVTAVPRTRAMTPTDLAPHRIVIPEGRVYEKEYDFVRAHRTVNTWVKGYDPGPEATTRFEIGLTGAAVSYDYLLRVLPGQGSYTALTSPLSSGGTQYAHGAIHTPYDAVSDDAMLTIKSTTDGQDIIPPINLARYIGENHPGSDPLLLDEINILVTFAGGEVTVTLPDWENNEVGPEI